MSEPITVLVLAGLQRYRTERGLPVSLALEVPEDADGWWLADELGLPFEAIEGIFVNHVIHALSQRLMPGDRVAFIPYGTPGPHRVYLGLAEAGVENREALSRRESVPTDE